MSPIANSQPDRLLPAALLAWHRRGLASTFPVDCGLKVPSGEPYSGMRCPIGDTFLLAKARERILELCEPENDDPATGAAGDVEIKAEQALRALGIDPEAP